MDSESSLPPKDRLYLALTLVAFALAVAVIFAANDAFYRDFQRTFSHMPSVSHLSATANIVRVTIYFGEDRRRAFEGQASSDMTALAALRASAEAGQFELALDDRGRVVEIAGVRNRAGKIWQFDINGSPASSLPGETDLSGGERISFRYE